MNILIFGAGAIGTLYAGKLAAAGYEVSLLARGERLQQLQKHGVSLIDNRTRKVLHTKPAILGQIASDDCYDFILLCVRADQIESALSHVKALSSGTIVPMVNHAAGFSSWAEKIGKNRLLVGFPGAGAAIEGNAVSYSITPKFIQCTTLGELDGHATLRAKTLATALSKAGFNVDISNNIDAWQRYHAAYISAFFLGIAKASGDVDRFLATPDLQKTVFLAIKESFAMLEQSYFPVTPTNLNALKWLPTWSLVKGFTTAGKITSIRQAFAEAGSKLALHEGPVLGGQIMALAQQAQVDLPHYQRLFTGV